MTINIERTARHLREHVVAQGADERMRAMQALSAGYLNDSRGVLSELLLATLGGVPAASDAAVATTNTRIGAMQRQPATMRVGQVVTSGQMSANDSIYEDKEAS